MRPQDLQVGVVLHPVGQADVEVARDLAHGIVLLGVDGEGEQVGVVGEAIRRAVALVHVEVDHQRPRDRAARAFSALAAIATSLKTQKPAPVARCP